MVSIVKGGLIYVVLENSDFTGGLRLENWKREVLTMLEIQVGRDWLIDAGKYAVGNFEDFSQAPFKLSNPVYPFSVSIVSPFLPPP